MKRSRGLVLLLAAFVVAGVAVFVATRASAPRERPDDLLSQQARAFADARPVRIGWYRGGEPVSIWRGDVVAGGYAVEEWNLLAIKLGFSIEHLPFDDPGSVVTALREGTIDIAGGLGNRPDMQDFAARTDPLALERVTFAGAAAQAGRALGTLADRTVTTIPGSPLLFALQAAYPQATFIPTDSIAGGLRATADGEIDLYLGPLGVIGYALREQGLDLVPLGETIETVPVSAWAETGSPALAFAQEARSHLTDEEISLATLRWSGFDLGPAASGTPRWLGRLLLVAIALLVVSAAFTLVLRRRVRAATAALSTLNAQLEDRVSERTRELDDAVAKLETTNEALRDFAGTIAHDLRGPLGAISGFAGLLQLDEVSQENRERMLTALESSAKRLVGMVDALLEDAARVGARPAALTGPEFEAWLLEVVGPEADAAGATVDVTRPDGTIGLDVVLLQRATLNLVGNALKYARAGDGTVVEVALREHPNGDWELIVDDNGPGVPAELRERVFELGFRAVTDGQGQGLGLAETRELVERQGGAIEVADSPLGGARFSVHVPAVGSA